MASDDSHFTVAPVLDGRIGFIVTKHVQLTLGVTIMLPLRSDLVVFEGQAVGKYGELFFVPALGVQAGIP